MRGQQASQRHYLVSVLTGSVAFDVAETLMKLKFAFQAEGHNPDIHGGQKGGVWGKRFWKKRSLVL